MPKISKTDKPNRVLSGTGATAKKAPAGPDWGQQFVAAYERAKHDKIFAEIRKLKVQQRRRRRVQLVPIPPPEEKTKGYIDEARRRRDEAAKDRDDILRFYGHRLPAEGDPILRLWVASTPRGRRMLVGDTKVEAGVPSCKMKGLFEPYVVANGDMRSVLRVDLDVSFHDLKELEDYIAGRGMPSPNFVVAGSAVVDDAAYDDEIGDDPVSSTEAYDPDAAMKGEFYQVHRPHLIYILRDAVAFCGAGKISFQRLWKGVLAGLTVGLGADAGGLSNALRCKNPLSPRWENHILRDYPWTLDELRQSVDIKARPENPGVLSPYDYTPDHHDPEIASQSNRLFASIAKACNDAVGTARQQGMTRNLFAAAQGHEAAFFARTERDEGYYQRLGESCARWAWDHWREPKPKADANEVRKARAEAATVMSQVRAGRNRKEVMKAYHCVSKSGVRPSAWQISLHTGLAESTVKRHLRALLRK